VTPLLRGIDFLCLLSVLSGVMLQGLKKSVLNRIYVDIRHGHALTGLSRRKEITVTLTTKASTVAYRHDLHDGGCGHATPSPSRLDRPRRSLEARSCTGSASVASNQNRRVSSRQPSIASTRTSDRW